MLRLVRTANELGHGWDALVFGMIRKMCTAVLLQTLCDSYFELGHLHLPRGVQTMSAATPYSSPISPAGQQSHHAARRSLVKSQSSS